MNKIIIIIIYLTLFFTLNSCDDSKKSEINTNLNNIEEKTKEEDDGWCDSLATMKFQNRYISDENDLNELRNEFDYSKSTSIKYKILITLNRKDFRFIRVGDTVVVPERISENILDYSIFPNCYKNAKDISKLIIISNKYQCYACYENGKLVRYAAVNTGKERTQTYPGKYYTNWKKAKHRSSLDSNWVIPYTVNFHLQAGNAFHQFTMPGRPVSHSCVRQFMSDAQWLFNWVEKPKYDTSSNIVKKGTLVLILDVFDFTRAKFGPWLDLADNKSANIDLPEDPLNFEEPFIPLVQIPQGARGALKNINRYKYAVDSLIARGYLRNGITVTPSVNYNALRKKRREAAAKAQEEKLKLEQETQAQEE